MGTAMAPEAPAVRVSVFRFFCSNSILVGGDGTVEF